MPPWGLSMTGLLFLKNSGVGIPASKAKSARKDAVDKRLSGRGLEPCLSERGVHTGTAPLASKSRRCADGHHCTIAVQWRKETCAEAGIKRPDLCNLHICKSVECCSMVIR